MNNRRVALNRSVAVAATLVLLVGSASGSWADQVLRNLKRPLLVELQSPVQGATATVGQSFEANLAEPAHYKNWTLPAGTHFKGHIASVGHSKHFGRPGYVELQPDEASLPNGQSVSFDATKYAPPHKKLHHPDTETFPQSVVRQSALTAISLGVTVPLHYAGDVNVLQCFVIGEGVRMAAGAVFGLVRPKYRNEPVPRKIALGALDGSGIPRLVNFIGTYPEPDYHPGDKVKLYVNPNGLQDLFKAGQTTVIPIQSRLTAVVEQPAQPALK